LYDGGFSSSRNMYPAMTTDKKLFVTGRSVHPFCYLLIRTECSATKGDNSWIIIQSETHCVSDEFVRLMLDKTLLHIHYAHNENRSVTLRRHRAKQIRGDLTGTNW